MKKPAPHFDIFLVYAEFILRLLDEHFPIGLSLTEVEELFEKRVKEDESALEKSGGLADGEKGRFEVTELKALNGTLRFLLHEGLIIADERRSNFILSGKGLAALKMMREQNTPIGEVINQLIGGHLAP
jgi:hypothetical protein